MTYPHLHVVYNLAPPKRGFFLIPIFLTHFQRCSYEANYNSSDNTKK